MIPYDNEDETYVYQHKTITTLNKADCANGAEKQAAMDRCRPRVS